MRIIFCFLVATLFTCSTIWGQATTKIEAQDFEAYEQIIPGTNVSFQMTPIPAGTFLMGSPAEENNRKEDEGPQNEVAIEGFWMGVHEVTFDTYEVFRDKLLDKAPEGKEDSWNVDAVTRPSPPYEDPTFGMGKYGFPAVSMTQYTALSYCKWLSEKTGVFYRLPTEAEWEYACKAGTTTAYSFGNEVDSIGTYAWYYDNSDEKYHKVGEKKPNPWGLYDMHGNAAEWTLDQYVDTFYTALSGQGSPVVSPWSLPTKLHPRTVKGGSWDDDPTSLRSSARTRSSMKWKKRDPQIPKSFWWNTDSPFVGFRIIRPQKQLSPEEIKAFFAGVLDE